MREIYIRKMRYEEAKYKLERELHAAFMEGETLVEVIHGIGEGKLKQLTEDMVNEYDFLRLYKTDEWIYSNPGSTKVEIFPPDKADLKNYKK
ncbi:MAG: Smr/MutS family protein [Leptospiraceae bacterium]|nr:Smr/MutS family protein [Leptospiraceae bacterium]MCP5500101.1 Smr/MutS family protein [Leptospiraceae bacterium]